MTSLGARPLVISEDLSVIDAVVRLAAARVGEVLVATDSATVQGQWLRAPLVLVGADYLERLALRDLPRRSAVLVVAAEIPVGHLLWQQAVAIGAEHVVDLREGERFLAQAFARVADGPSRDGHLLVVTGATGGVGASTLAVNLAFTAAESGKRTILIDGDPLGGGIDLLLGMENSPGIRWSAIDPGAGQLSAPQLAAALPSLGSVSVLSADSEITPRAEVIEVVIDAARRAFDQVIIDLPRPSSEHSRMLLQRADGVILAVNAHVRGASAAARAMAHLGSLGVHYRVVVTEQPKGIAADEIATALRTSVAVVIPFIPSTPSRADSGEPPPLTSAYAAACRALLGSHLQVAA